MELTRSGLQVDYDLEPIPAESTNVKISLKLLKDIFELVHKLIHEWSYGQLNYRVCLTLELTTKVAFLWNVFEK